MWYQVLIETKEKVGRNNGNRKYYELDKNNLEEIMQDVIIPYLNKKEFQFDGYFLNPNDIVRLVVKETDKTTRELSKYENDNMPPGVIMYVSPKDIVEYDEYTRDITKNVFISAKEKIEKSEFKKTTARSDAPMDKTKVFIVHGHDDLAMTEVARFIEKLKLQPIILHEQANSGITIIEKIEKHTNVGYGIAIYTPCDLGALNTPEPKLRARARQNVVFEHGFLIGKLGRGNVCALVKGEVEIPTDISGIVYIPMDDHKAWYIALAKEMRNSGYDIDMNLII